MAEIDYLISDSLFAHVPQTNAATIDQFYDLEYVRSASNQELIDCTYYLLRSGQLTIEETLKVWEIRLTLTLFNDQLPLAKREAVNLNNALYIHENPNTQPPPNTSRVGSNLSANESASLAAHSRAALLNNVVYPLPKNNNGQIGYRLLLMILRLKSIPNLILVNELYKLCYQMRLKGTSSEAIKVQAKLTNLSYEVIMVLTITRNYFTLISFLNSLRHDVRVKIELAEKGSHNERYHSNVCLLHVIISLLVWTKGKSKTELDQVPKDVTELFNQVDETSLVTLKHVLQTVPSVVGGLDPGNAIKLSETLTLPKLVEMVWDKKISARVLCCTLATWELSNVHHTELVEEDGKSRLIVETIGDKKSKLDHVYGEIMPRWGQYINKVYGLE